MPKGLRALFIQPQTLFKPATIGLLCFGLSAAVSAQDEVTLPGISANVTVSTDQLGIPSIHGQTENDVAFMQGWLHARDRFFAMDLNRRVASGTAGELFGPSVLPDDIQLRTLGLRRAAWKTYTALSAETRAWLQSYSNGVNVYLANNDLPPEYGVLQLDQVPAWSPVDTIAVGKALAFQLSFDLDIENTILARAYQMAGEQAGIDGAALFSEDLVRLQPIDDRVSVPGFLQSIGGVMLPASTSQADGSVASGSSGEQKPLFDFPGLNFEEMQTIPESTVKIAMQYRDKIINTPLLGPALSRQEHITGSNTWTVSGAVSDSGMPMLAGDPHLSLSFPSVFTEEHIIIEELGISISGVSVPGTPGIIQGCSDHHCWSTTVNPMDVTDTYVETLVVNGLGLPLATMYQGQAEPLQAVFQSYFVNNSGDGEMNSVSRANVGYTEGGITFIVPRRNNGPLVDVDGTTGISVQYTGWGPTFELESFRQINRARSLDDFKAALQFFDVGSQNFMYADIEGNIAYFTSAENPIRADLQNDMAPAGGIPPFLIRNGTGELNHEWLPVTNPQPNQAVPYEIMPFSEMPQAENPDNNYLANANNDPIGVTLDNNPLNQIRPGGGLYYLNPGYTENRMGRIDRELQRLVAEGDVSLQAMIDVQANNQLLDAEIIMPNLLTAVGGALQFAQQAGVECPDVPDTEQEIDACDSRVTQVFGLMRGWDFSTPTGIPEGFDPGDEFSVLPPSVTGAPIPLVIAATEPTAEEITASVAATVFAAWRGQLIANSIDAVLDTVGLGDFKPSSSFAVSSVYNMIQTVGTNGGIGASGLPLLPEVLARAEELAALPPAEQQAAVTQIFLNYVTGSLRDALDLLASDEFAPAFANSTDLMDYRWGKLHRIVFDHPFNSDPFNVPNGGGFLDLADDLPGIARAGGYQAVDASSHNSRADSLNEFMFGHGPARRFVGIMSPDGIQGFETIPGGRSSNVTSPHYTDQLPLWLTNSFHPLTLGADAAAASAVSTVVYTPAGQ